MKFENILYDFQGMSESVKNRGYANAAGEAEVSYSQQS